MKAPLAALALLLSVTAATAAPVKAGDLAARCAADKPVCERAIAWVYANLGACSDARLSTNQVTGKVTAWLKKNPKVSAPSDNELAAAAVSALWPCHL